MPNRLAMESSPYLRQHMDNPVDWYPWGAEALQRARAEDKPILLSVGYAACHWCHVMAHESFADPAVAALVNREFLAIKVDREERPDLDHLYMAACQVFTGSGGWPLTVFLTPDLRPFFAGTYFPKESRYGRPGFTQVLGSLARAYREQRADVVAQARQFQGALEQLAAGPDGSEAAPPVSADRLQDAAEVLLSRFDEEHGGFGGAPKFPSTQELLVLEAAARRGHAAAGAASLKACAAMAQGGLFDQLGGGFHRYATDAAWRVPHFEKMLYDNALLPRVYLAAWRRTGESWLQEVVARTLAYVEREMGAPSGAFYATQDADSDGGEGRFFVWTPQEVEAVLGVGPAQRFCTRFGVTPEGNFEHRTSVLHQAVGVADLARHAGLPVVAVEQELRESVARLMDARAQRPRPARDEKVITGWNALMASAFLDAASTWGNPAWRGRGVAALEFILEHLRAPGGGLWRVHAGGQARIAAFLEDYAFLAQGLWDAYRAGAGSRFLSAARDVCGQLLDRFYDEDAGGFFITEREAPDVLVRARALHDDAVPCGAFVAAQALLSVGSATGEARFTRVVDRVLAHHAVDLVRRAPAVSSLLGVVDRVVDLVPTVVVAGPRRAELLHAARALTEPSVLVLDAADAGLDTALVRDRPAGAFVCARGTCQSPAVTPAELRRALQDAGVPVAAVLQSQVAWTPGSPAKDGP